MKTLISFTNELKQQVDDFVEYWLSSQEKHNNYLVWPDKMNLPEWQEQFLAYIQMKENKE